MISYNIIPGFLYKLVLYMYIHIYKLAYSRRISGRERYILYENESERRKVFAPLFEAKVIRYGIIPTYKRIVYWRTGGLKHKSFDNVSYIIIGNFKYHFLLISKDSWPEPGKHFKTWYRYNAVYHSLLKKKKKSNLHS